MGTAAAAAAFPYLEFTVLSTLAVHLFEYYLLLRQYRNYHAVAMPARLRGVVSEQKFARAQAYGRDRAGFSLVVSPVQAGISLLGLYFGLTPTLWRLAGAWQQQQSQSQSQSPLLLLPLLRLGNVIGEEYARLLLFSAASYAVSTALSLPFRVYSTFVVEQRHGFNRTTPLQFVKDLVLSAFVAAALGAPVLCGLHLVLQRYGDDASRLWFYVWLALVAVALVMMVLYPSVIAPLFNTFTPLPPGELRASIERLAASVRFPLRKLYVVDGTRRSSHSNAYFYGLGRHKRIVLFDSLLEQNAGHDERVLSVLAHELGHWRLSHMPKNMLFAMLHMAGVLKAYSAVAHGNAALYTSFRFDAAELPVPHILGLMLFMEMLSPLDSVLGYASNVLSRRFEYQADAFAKQLGHADSLAAALVGLHVDNLSNMVPDRLYSAYNFSHPTLVERLDALGVKPAAAGEGAPSGSATAAATAAGTTTEQQQQQQSSSSSSSGGSGGGGGDDSDKKRA